MLNLNEKKDELVFGIIYFCLSCPLIPLYLLVVWAVHLRNELKPSMTFKMVNLIHFWQIGQTFGHLITAPILIFPELQHTAPFVLRIIGSFMSLCYNAELPTMALLAVSRVFVFSNVLSKDEVPLFVKIILPLVLLCWFIIFIYSISTGFFIFVSPGWTFNSEVPYAIIIENAYLITSLMCLFISYISYLVIVFMIYVRKKDSTSSSSKKEELSIMIQYTILVVYTTVGIFLWHKAAFWFDIQSTAFRGSLNIMWIMGSYLNPALILIFNKAVRKECKKIMARRNIGKVKHVSSTASSK